MNFDQIEFSRNRLLQAIGAPPNLTLIRPLGNIGDRLIQAGTRQLLSRVGCRDYVETDVHQLRRFRGHTALLGGSGGWCRPFHGLAQLLPEIERRFERVIVLPSSFDTTVEAVSESLRKSHAVVFAREDVSFRNIRSLCHADMAHDCAFYFDFSPYRRPGQGVLTAFRTDEESAFPTVPPGNDDISVRCSSLDEWLWTIARHDRILTDRAHVTIAGAMLGKAVDYLSSCYHKVPAIVAHSLQGLPVSPLPDGWAPPKAGEGRLTDAERLRLLRQHVTSLVPDGAVFLLVDDGEPQWPSPPGRRRLPFLEKNGCFWGLPADDSHAIAELERMRDGGAEYLIFAAPSFWWFDHYTGFHEHLRARFPCPLDDDVAVCFDLRQQSEGG